ncbi:MAG: class I SAM-dependent methyltransferase [Ktedonobacteraceae bacterium]
MDIEQNMGRDPQTFNQEVQAIWNQNAAFWDERMGEGNDFQRILVGPGVERLLNLQAGELVLEIGCGNGLFARRMARLGAQVIATDFSEQLLERAKARTVENAERIEYRYLDATDEAQLLALGSGRFDAIVSNMVIMDMATIDPLMRSIPTLLKPGGRFVFALMHPCFNTSGTSLLAEEEDRAGDLVTEYTIKVAHYLDLQPQKGTAIVGQPQAHYYFHRPLHELLGICFRAGLVMDGIDEPAFDHPHDGSRPSSRTLTWINYTQIPPVLVVRMRVA